jgi:membrane protein DedA with SNARE-associated domain
MHPHFAYGLVLLLAFSESLPVLGAVVPGTAIIIGLAALVPSGVLKLSPLLVAALIGAMIGDGLSFWLGHRYHEQILTRWPFRRYPQLIERSEAFFKKSTVVRASFWRVSHRVSAPLFPWWRGC